MAEKSGRHYSGAKVAELRKSLGMTHGDLAIGIFRAGATKHIPSRQQVHAWEAADGYAPRSAVIAAIAEVLGVTMDDLFSHM